MIAVPGLTPQSEPPALIVATDGSRLDHAPPGVPLVSGVQKPIHVRGNPVIEAGNGFTVTTIVVRQPVGNVNVIRAVPAETPVTTPVTASIAAIAGLALLHVPGPPGEALLSVVIDPTHTTGVPSIGSGFGFTVKVAATVQPEGNV
jgi:hypothetical protein